MLTVLLLFLGFYCKNRVEGRNYLNWLFDMDLPIKGHLIASIACFVLGAVASTLAIASGITIFS